MSLPHGGNIEEMAKLWHCQTSDILDLSTGLHPSGAPTWLAQWLKDNAELVAHYPDKHGEPARAVLADFMGIAPESILIIAGAQAAIEILPQAMGWKNMAIKQPCYSEPLRAAQRAGCTITTIDIHTQNYPDDCDCIWITSPQNPFGFTETFPSHRHGVFDESYMPFSERLTLGIMPKVIRLGSLTKTFCIPGLRLGYIIAEPTYIQAIQAWLPPWPTSTLAIHLLPKLLCEADKRDAEIKQLNQRMRALLTRYNWEVSPSLTSFLLARPTHQLPDFVSSRILVRQFDEWSTLDGWLRLGYPLKETDWQRLEHALNGSQAELPAD